jgi:hypothetical protein
MSSDIGIARKSKKTQPYGQRGSHDCSDESRREILLVLSDVEHRRLVWMAERLGLSISETLRSLIPSVPMPQSRILDDVDGAASASLLDAVRVRTNLDLSEVRVLLDEMHRSNAAVTLAKEISRQLCDQRRPYLTVETCRRLGRWCHPYRWTERERMVQPVAKKLSILLFGKILNRSEM